MRDTKEQMAVMENPYVEQIEKFAASLQKLSGIFLSLEGTKETICTGRSGTDARPGT